MKRGLFFSTLLTSAVLSSAMAADLPTVKGPPVMPPPPPPIWTGFYAGLNAGYGFGTNSNVQAAVIGQDAGIASSQTFDASPVYTLQTDAAPIYSPIFLPTGAGLAQSGTFSANQNGFIGGGQLGYNYQWGPNFVIGIEADMQGAGIRGRANGVGSGWGSTSVNWNEPGLAPTTPSPSFGWDANSVGITSVNAGVNWMGTVRGRVGYLFTPTMLLYATGGLTYGGVYANVNNAAMTSIRSQSNGFAVGAGAVQELPFPPMPQSYSGSSSYTFVGGGNKSSTLVGWNVGGGIEWMFMPNWSLKAEGIYWNMGNMTMPTMSLAAAPDSSYAPLATIGAVRVNYQGVIARAGVNYHFNWGAAAPVVAKY